MEQTQKYDEWIPSEYVRNYYREKGIAFTDYEWACIRWNQRIPRAKKLEALSVLAQETADEKLKTALRKRLSYERELERAFADNEERKYIYTICFQGEEWTSGYSANAEIAFQYGRADKEHRPFVVEKWFVMTDRISGECEAVGMAAWNADGMQMQLWVADELLSEAVRNPANACIENEFNRAFFMENPFEKGDVVRLLESGDVGFVGTSQEEWLQAWEKLKKCTDEGMCADYADSSTIFVSLPGGDHTHACILNLEKVRDFTFEVRWSQESDEKGIKNLLKDAFGTMAEKEGAFEDIACGRYLVAVADGGEILALTGLRDNQEYADIQITWTATKPEYRHMGIMQELFRTLLATTNRTVYCCCWRIGSKEQVNLHTLMERFGFEEVIHNMNTYRKDHNCLSGESCPYFDRCIGCSKDLFMRKGEPARIFDKVEFV